MDQYGRVSTYLDSGVIVTLFDDNGETKEFRVKSSGMYDVIATKALINGKELTLQQDPMLEWLTNYEPTVVKVSEAI